MTRRAVLSCGAALVLGGAAGAAFQVAGSAIDGTPVQPAAPPELLAALASESSLISAIDGATSHDPSLRSLLTGVRADHIAHQAVLRAALAAYASPSANPTPRNPVPLNPTQTSSGQASPGPGGLGRTQLRSLEQRASAAVSGYARAVFGPDASVLASISACEASHAELLA
ncbi:MAG: hypothetical protein M3N95_12445 [Actinomycetota bacterium]|nr:hypothetical protein [Actinomycetota bacterium]